MRRTPSANIRWLCTGLVLFGVTVMLDDGRAMVFCAAAAVVALGIAIYRLVSGWMPSFVSLRVFCIVYLLQNVWLCLYVLTTDDPTIWNTALKPDFTQSPYLCTLPSLVILGVIAIIAFIFRTPGRTHRPFVALAQMQPFPRGLGRSLIALNSIVPLYFVAVQSFGELGLSYVILFMQSGAICAPFLIGYYWRHLGAPKWWSVGLLLLSAILAFAEGSRSYIFFPFAFIATGFLLSALPSKRVVILSVYAACAVPLFIVVAAIGSIRGEIRQASDNFWERGSLMLERFWDPIQEYGSLVRGANLGVWRMMSWTGAAIPILTPDPMQYRGYDDLAEELMFNSRLLVLDYRGAERRVYSSFGLGVASEYGFVVNEYATVPFGLIADSWSRDGARALALYTAILAAFFLLLERGVYWLWSKDPVFLVLMLTIQVGQVFYRVDTVPALTAIRYGILTFIFWAVLLKGIRICFPASRSARYVRAPTA